MGSSVDRAWGGVLLTGGTGVRLGGADKAGLRVGDHSLLDRARAALADLATVVVVGAPVPGLRSVREDPPGGGPAAGLLAGLDALPREVTWVVALAVDMPFVGRDTLARLRAALEVPARPDGAVLLDATGRRQPLCAAYRRAALLAAAPDDVHGLPLRRLVSGLDLVEVPAEGSEAEDVDHPADLDRARRRLDPG